MIPVWQNKLQARAYEDALYTRISHYSYEIRNNKLRLYPFPQGEVDTLWFEFSIPKDTMFEFGKGTNSGFAGETATRTTIGGINNLNTLPFGNIPYQNINSIGKHWVRKFSLAICKEILGQIRSKFSQIPIPGESITLNRRIAIKSSQRRTNSSKRRT